MSLPWDPENIQPNLRTLSRLHRGEHLSVLKEGENLDTGTYTLNGRGLRSRFKIEGKLKPSFVRTKKGETILNDQQYFYPLKQFFAEAASAWGRNQISSDLLKAGYDGLKKLRDTYANDQTYKVKFEEILQVIESELRGIRVRGISLEQGESNLILGEQQFPGMRQWIMNKIMESSSTLIEEYATDVNKNFMKVIFGDAKPRRTRIPIGGFDYERQAMGVCWQYHRDAHQGTGVRLEGAQINCSTVNLAKLFKFVNEDDGLMFAVSQVATQGSVSGMANHLLHHAGKEGDRNVPLIQFGYERLLFNMGGGFCNISKLGNRILVSSTFAIAGNAGTTSQSARSERMGTAREFGVSSIRTEFAATLQRTGNTIDIQLHKAILCIATVPPRVPLTGNF